MEIKDFWYYYDLMSRLNNLWCTNNNKILKLTNNMGVIIMAHSLTVYCDENLWCTDNIKLLKTASKEIKNSVAHWLALYHPYWITINKKLLQLKNIKNETVKDVLIKKGKL